MTIAMRCFFLEIESDFQVYNKTLRSTSKAGDQIFWQNRLVMCECDAFVSSCFSIDLIYLTYFTRGVKSMTHVGRDCASVQWHF